jgi:hypothetical protein
MSYPRDIDVKFRVWEDGKIEILNKDGKDIIQTLSNSKPLKGHNSIGVLVSNPTCFIVGGKMYCY